MPPKTPPISLSLELDTASAERGAKKFEQAIKSTTARVEKAFKGTEESNLKALKAHYKVLQQGPAAIASAFKAEKKVNAARRKAFAETHRQYKDLLGQIGKQQKVLKNLATLERTEEVKDKRAHQERIGQTKQRLAGYQSELDALKRLRGAHQEASKKAREATGTARDKHDPLKAGEGISKAVDEMGKSAAEFGEMIAEPFRDLLNKDVGGAATKFATITGKGLDAVIKKVGKSLVGGLADKMIAKGAALKERGSTLSQAGRGVRGAAMEKMGGAMSAMGSMGKGLGPLLQAFAKFGPLLGTVSAALVGLVKMFLDAQAMAKDFNREILSTASTGKYLAKNMGNVGLAAADLESDLDLLRNQAYGFQSIVQGLTKEDFTTVSNALTSQGVSLKTVAREFERAQASGEGYAKVFSNNTHLAVAYSRTMGVSLQEVAGFQAELMTDMGMSVGGVADSFEAMQRSANEAGIEQHRFFAMIKSVSSDLALYNTRLDETVHILGALGKVMSPRNAQKFLQTVTSAMKGMSNVDRLKMNLLAGGKMGAMNEKDMARRSKGLSAEIGRSGGKQGLTQKDLLTGNVQELLEGVADEQKGALREAISELRYDKTANKKGVYGAAVAGQNLGPAATAQLMKDQLNLTGKGKLRDRVGDLGAEELAKNQGADLRSLAKFEDAVDEQRDWLEKNKDTDAGKKALAAAGLSADKIQTADFDDIVATMDKGQQNNIKEMTAQRDYAKEQANMTTSLLQKIDQMLAFFQNQLYNAVIGIWEGIMSLPGIGDGGKGKAKAAAYKTKNQDLIAAVESATDGKDLASKVLSSGPGKGVQNALLTLPEKIAAMQKEEDAAGGAGDTAKAEALRKQKEALQGQYSSARQSVEGQIAGGQDGAIKKFERLMTAASGSGLGDDTLIKLAKTLAEQASGGKSEDVNLDKAAMSAGVSEEEVGRIYAKVMESLSGAQLVTAVSGAGMPAVGPPTAQPPPAQVAQMAAAQSTADSTKATAAAVEKTADHAEATTASLANLETTTRQKGIVIDKSQWKTRVQDQADKGMLGSLRTALYEFYLYKDLAQGDVQKAIQAGLTPATLGPRLAEEFAKGANMQQAIAGLKPNAEGGMVDGITAGLARIRPAPGEGLASVGRGERIVPAGGGGSAPQVIELRLTGELSRFVEAKASDVYARNVSISKRQ